MKQLRHFTGKCINGSLTVWRAGKPHLRRAAIALTIVAILQTLIFVFDPFGMEEAISARASLVLQKVTAPFYHAWHQEGTIGRNKVTVVLIDQRYFDASAGGLPTKPVWPLPVSKLFGDVIDPIVKAKPRALFIDIAFPDAPRETSPKSTNSRSDAVNKLAEGLRTSANSVPIYLSDVIVATPDQEAETGSCRRFPGRDADLQKSDVLAPDLNRLLFKRSPHHPPTKNLEVVDSAVGEGSARYLLAPMAYMSPPASDPVASAVRAKDICARKGTIPTIASPALALFHFFMADCRRKSDELCTHPGNLALDKLIQRPSLPEQQIQGTGFRYYNLTDKAHGTLSPQWGVWLSHGMSKLYLGAQNSGICRSQFYASQLDSVRSYMLQIFGPVEHLFGQGTIQRCPFIDTISAADLLDARLSDPNATSGDPPEAVHDLLENRIVMLAANIPQAQDRFDSPVNGDIPGVYVHADALENLLTAGIRYRHADHGWAATAGIFALVIVLIATMTAAWAKLCETLHAKLGAAGRFILAPILYLVFVLAVSVTLGAWLFFKTDLPMADIATPLIALHAILFGGYLEGMREYLRAKADKWWPEKT